MIPGSIGQNGEPEDAMVAQLTDIKIEKRLGEGENGKFLRS